jgi:hypothetical protein
MPVDCRFQMYPWKDLNDPNYKEYNGIEGNGRFNYLLYLEMTGNKDGTVPEIVDKGRYLEEIGNWTDGRNPGKDPSSKFGTFMLTEKKFLEEFLLPKFDKMNRMVKIDLSDLKAEVYTKGLYSYFPRDIQLAIGAGVHAGPDDGDAQYRFQKIPAPKDMSFPTQLPSDALKWYWTFIDDEMKAHNSDRYLNFGYKAEHWGEAKSVFEQYQVPDHQGADMDLRLHGYPSFYCSWEQSNKIRRHLIFTDLLGVGLRRCPERQS